MTSPDIITSVAKDARAEAERRIEEKGFPVEGNIANILNIPALIEAFIEGAGWFAGVALPSREELAYAMAHGLDGRDYEDAPDDYRDEMLQGADAVLALLGGDRICEEENLMNITDFLEARITEDEAEADRVLYDLGAGDLDSLTEKMFAECRAKRAIIEAHPVKTKWMLYGVDGEEPYCAAESDPDGIMTAGQPFPCPTIRHLAAVYSDHPDYDEAWRP